MRYLSLVAVVALAGVLAVAAHSAATPPQLAAFSVDSVHVSPTGLRLTVGGTINCTAKGHFHISAWIYQGDRGAMAKASLPAPLGFKPTKAALAQHSAASACNGSAQGWSLGAPAAGKHPAGFAAGAAQACTVVTVSKSRRYFLQSNCVPVTIG